MVSSKTWKSTPGELYFLRRQDSVLRALKRSLFFQALFNVLHFVFNNGFWLFHRGMQLCFWAFLELFFLY